MKVFVAFFCFLAIVVCAVNRAANYWFGYDETFKAFAWCDPLSFLFIEGLLFLALIGGLIASCYRKRGRLLSAAVVLGFWPALIVTIFIPPHPCALVVRGLRDRTLHDYTLDELREFAREVKESNLSALDGGTDTPADHDSYQRLATKYPFLYWMNEARKEGIASIYDSGDPNLVTCDWGGELIGHHGFSIRVDGKRNDPPPGSYAIRASDDIYFFFE